MSAQWEGVLSDATASALVGAAMLSVLIFPTIALRLLGDHADTRERSTGHSA